MTHSQLLATFKADMPARNDSNDAALADIFVGLLDRYFERVPDAKKMFQLCQKRGDQVINDHVAFRTLDMIPLLKLFLHYNYDVQFEDQSLQLPFNFDASNKKLTAVWLKHPNEHMPRVFISKIRLDDISPKAIQIIQPYLQKMINPIDSLDLADTTAVVNYLHTGLWPTPTYEAYQHVSQYSEYLAWVLYNEYYLNHFTLTINTLQSFKFQEKIQDCINKQTNFDTCLTQLKHIYKESMTSFNQFLMDNGFSLNTPQGNALNISPDGLLLQSSTKANMIDATFPDGTYKIPGSYVEFAYRGLLDKTVKQLINGQLDFNDISTQDLRDGFETKNANSIFESTYTRDEKDSISTQNTQSNKDKLLNPTWQKEQLLFLKDREALIDFLASWDLNNR